MTKDDVRRDGAVSKGADSVAAGDDVSSYGIFPPQPPSNTSNTRHRRSTSKPLRVRTVSISHARAGSGTHPGTLHTDEQPSTAILSPSTADLPSALPSSTHNSSRRRASITAASPDLPSPDHQGDPDALAAPSHPGASSEMYGFVVYVGSLVAWYAFLVWGFAPDRFLAALGIEWYPNREWAILVPAWIMVAVVFVYTSYFALNLYHTPPLGALCSITDSQANLLPSTEGRRRAHKPLHTVVRSTKGAQEEDFIPPLCDLPPAMINKAVFGGR